MVDQAPPTETVEKLWGKFERYTYNLLSTVKVITVRPGAALSLQYHNKRDELWVALDPGAQVEVGDRVLKPEVEETVFIPRRTPHRLSAVGEEPVRILEISLGEFDEEDIVRLEDIYGRVEIANTT
jgi:mannose-6-phosphate isomerase